MSMRNLSRSKINLVTACLNYCRVADPRNNYLMTQEKYKCFSKVLVMKVSARSDLVMMRWMRK